MHLFLLIGQSNMVGHAPIEKQDRELIKNVYLLNNKHKWEPASVPYNRYSKYRLRLDRQKLNCGPSFAKEYQKANPGVPIGIVCYARGGSFISQWQKNRKKLKLYQASIEAVKKVEKQVIIKGIIWHQGEVDIYMDFNRYKKQLTSIIENYRKDLNLPYLPFVFGQLAYPDQTNAKKRKLSAIERFNTGLMKLAKSIPQTACVSSRELTTMDGIHFDTRSQRVLGKRYFNKLIKILKNIPEK